MGTVTLDNKTILVTGAAGFIGSNLVKRIYQETPSATVIGIDNMNAYYDVALKEFRLNELAKGDLEGYGQLVFESGKSSIYSYECGCDELKKLYEIMTDTDGIYGGRFSGAGFKGCCMALIDPDKAEDIEAKVTAEYLKAFPALEGKYSFGMDFLFAG